PPPTTTSSPSWAATSRRRSARSRNRTSSSSSPIFRKRVPGKSCVDFYGTSRRVGCSATRRRSPTRPSSRRSSHSTRSTRDGATRPKLRGLSAGRARRRSVSLDFARAPQHLVDLGQVHRLFRDEAARVLLEEDVATGDELEQLLVEREPDPLVFERFAQDVADVVAVRLEQLPDRERRVLSEKRDHLARLLGVTDRFRRLLAQPGDDRDPVVAVDHERGVG